MPVASFSNENEKTLEPFVCLNTGPVFHKPPIPANIQANHGSVCIDNGEQERETVRFYKIRLVPAFFPGMLDRRPISDHL